jgi:hypothetical protein
MFPVTSPQAQSQRLCLVTQLQQPQQQTPLVVQPTRSLTKQVLAQHRLLLPQLRVAHSLAGMALRLRTLLSLLQLLLRSITAVQATFLAHRLTDLPHGQFPTTPLVHHPQVVQALQAHGESQSAVTLLRQLPLQRPQVQHLQRPQALLQLPRQLQTWLVVGQEQSLISQPQAQRFN